MMLPANGNPLNGSIKTPLNPLKSPNLSLAVGT
jgi:hypothetical protein